MQRKEEQLLRNRMRKKKQIEPFVFEKYILYIKLIGFVDGLEIWGKEE